MMLGQHCEPIVAVATAAGRGAVGVVRVSGTDLKPLIQAICGREVLTPRHAFYLPFLDAQGEAIDQGLAIYFPAPHSYTGEEVLEFQAHGGPVVLQLLVTRCLEVGASLGLRLAQPGEFTQRAYLHGKLDLAQAEAVSDLIDAGTDAAARSAGRSLAGVFSDRVDVLRERLVRLRMLVEATLDFPEEEIDFLKKTDALGQLTQVKLSLELVLDQARQGALLREGIHVVLAGQPNVGKSSLLNALAGVDLAIVTAVAGTTRDKVVQVIEIEGVPIHVIDTAGLRDGLDEVECLGVARSWDEVARADAVIFLHDLTRLTDAQYAYAEEKIERGLKDKLLPSAQMMHVFNKSDACVPCPWPTLEPQVVVSAQTGEGLGVLRQTLLRLAGWSAQPDGVFIARTRHVQALRKTLQHLLQAAVHLDGDGTALDLLAEELRLAHDALGEITGEFTSDDLLGEIFQRFCIGK
jgi:tRNA modification GTPase